VILVDVNSVGFAATAGTKLSSGSQPTQGIFGVMRRIRDLRVNYAGRILCLWDGRSWRFNEFPEYKAKRKVDPKLVALKDEWKKQRTLTAQMLKHMGVDQLIAENMEADDLAGRIVAARDEPTILVSGDKDWLQLVNENVSWIDPTHDRQCRLGNFKEISGFETPWQFIQAKALAGDAGDCVPPVGGIGPAGAQWIFEQFGSVNDLLERSFHGMTVIPSWPKKIRDFVSDPIKRDAYHRNMRLVWLQHPDLPPMANRRLNHGALNRDAFIDLAGECAFHSLLRDVDGWLKPFTAMETTA
jgi:5'-3' exonuclease